MKQKAVFLDRDGVLNTAIVKNGKPYPPTSLAELHIPSEVPTALKALKTSGYLLIAATNQPDVSRGTTPLTFVQIINTEIQKILPLDDFRICIHDDKDDCHCRKPSPGLLIDAAKQYDIDLTTSFMIGDRWKDIAAGKKAGCKTIWINRKYDEKKPEQPDFETDGLLKAVEWILKNPVLI